MYLKIKASLHGTITAQKMKFSIKDFFSKCDQILSFLRFWLHLLKNSLMENFIFCAVYIEIGSASFETFLPILWKFVLKKSQEKAVSFFHNKLSRHENARMKEHQMFPADLR